MPQTRKHSKRREKQLLEDPEIGKITVTILCEGRGKRAENWHQLMRQQGTWNCFGSVLITMEGINKME